MAGSHGASGNRNARSGSGRRVGRRRHDGAGQDAWPATSASRPAASRAPPPARRRTSPASARDHATDTLYQQGTQAGQYLTRNVNDYPLTALLVAGAIGYGLGYLIHSGWTSEGWSGSSDNDRHDSNDRNRRRRRLTQDAPGQAASPARAERPCRSPLALAGAGALGAKSADFPREPGGMRLRFTASTDTPRYRPTPGLARRAGVAAFPDCLRRRRRNRRRRRHRPSSLDDARCPRWTTR